MRIDHLIKAKGAANSHSPEEIRTLVHAYSRGEVADSKMSTWVEAVHSKGMSDKEIVSLVDAMLTSGERMDFSNLQKFVADKHSTGGVGDKVSLVLGPLMAAAGLAIPMISGRSLGHTGGTVDKLDAIPGYRSDLSTKEFWDVVERVGISMISQTEEICPADRKMYALRDTMGKIKSIPFICGSIMSKKIAEGIQSLVMDVKVGSGAFMRSLDEGKELGEKLSMVGDHFGISVDVVFSDMGQPLGREAGLWNEIQESILTLCGKGPEDLTRLTYELGNYLLQRAGKAKDDREATEIQKELIQSGEANEKFREMIQAHGGSLSALGEPDYYGKGRFTSEVLSTRSGYITSMETSRIGKIVNRLTVTKTGSLRHLDPGGGIQFRKKIGDEVETGEILSLCFGSDEKKVKEAASDLARLMTIGEERVAPPALFYS